MHLIGLLGGVASGKSFVARQLAAWGAGVLDADRAAHEVLREPATEEAARARWGERVFGPDGRIDRSKLAQVVFSPLPEGVKERAYLEKLIHPEVGRRLREEAGRLADLVSQEMAGAQALRVPLKVDVKQGPSWADMQRRR